VVTVTVARAVGLRPAFVPLVPAHADTASTVANAAPVIPSNAPLAQHLIVVALSSAGAGFVNDSALGIDAYDIKHITYRHRIGSRIYCDEITLA